MYKYIGQIYQNTVKYDKHPSKLKYNVHIQIYCLNIILKIIQLNMDKHP